MKIKFSTHKSDIKLFDLFDNKEQNKRHDNNRKEGSAHDDP